MPITLILVDDHPIVLQGLEKLFDNGGEFEVLACCRGGDEAIAAAETAQPDVVVLDLKMPRPNGLDVLRAFAAGKVRSRTVLLTAALGENEAAEALRLGALGIVLKDSSPDALVECVRHVARGETWMDSNAGAPAFDRAAVADVAVSEKAAALTKRELEMVRMIARGLRNKAIADRLSISEGTVKIHLHNIYQKMQVDGRLELMLYAQQKGLI